METNLLTFLCVCETLNYRKAAEILHLSQPAISKQMKALEEKYGVPLLHYHNRKLSLTEQGKILREYALSMKKCDQDLAEAIKLEAKHLLRIGVTKTIGDYYIGSAVAAYLQNSNREIDITMDNTECLLEMLDDNRIDLALVEGMVNKSLYQTFLIKDEDFVGICSANHRLAGRTVELRELEQETILVRESGSGTRDLLERELWKVGYNLDYFARKISISNFGLIKYLVAAGTGISFAYRAVVRDEKEYATFSVKGFTDKHEFNAVILKHVNLSEDIEAFLKGIE